MLILVGVVVSTTVNSNIIGKAKGATGKWKSEEENEANIAGATIGGKKYDSLQDYVNEGTPTKQEYEMKYYSTLGLAVADINNETIGENATEQQIDAVAGIHIKDNTPIITILKDTVETNEIMFSKNATVMLNGKTVTFNDCLGFSTVEGSGVKLYIDGSGTGGTISAITKTEKSSSLIIRTGTSVVAENVTFNATSEKDKAFGIAAGANSYTELKNCNITAKLENEGTYCLRYTS